MSAHSAAPEGRDLRAAGSTGNARILTQRARRGFAGSPLSIFVAALPDRFRGKVYTASSDVDAHLRKPPHIVARLELEARARRAGQTA